MGSILRGSPGGGKSTCSAAGPPTSPTFWARPFLASGGCGLPRWASSRPSPHSCFSMARDFARYDGEASRTRTRYLTGHSALGGPARTPSSPPVVLPGTVAPAP
ncbi:uncharacterized protein TrAFT101_001779 [Trichoderma asperellum]|uniref:Uncharacterized protein n=1 Tax=Trichoderma asperellum (strain ATCC 204424 / CBS 433.97 / NBRC 101777) TaxID=1042311 RepID=A0A2T3ZEK9_TRIA4|nr:hypothetical protein M441DRAFT_368068 [Trichoderma asperellum CBS 433.97]PTB43229.1 hypothetical protein M441DRAFT_368068 [Trichoderma asperellum CBS 433.97]UKZ85939.1 hypothetical protein TrAFT101_001779 [Trichoderma asperellum]WVH32731.1 putative peptidase family protein [Trichoderma asperellum]